jgi:transcriptional regulator with XRE-family HTH domain
MGTDEKRASEIFARQLRRYREQRELTASQLAERVTAAGGKLDRQAISKIERGARGVYLEEWLVLAFALNVPPLLLFLPLESQEEEIAITPTPSHTLPVMGAWKWIIGNQPPMERQENGLLYATGLGEWTPSRVPVTLSTELWDLGRDLQDAEHEFAAATQAENVERRRAAKEKYVDALTAYAENLDRMVEAGMDLPPQPAHRLEAMRHLGLPKKYRDRVPVWNRPTLKDGPEWFTPPPLVDEEE